MRKYRFVLFILLSLISLENWGQTKVWMRWESSNPSLKQDWESFPSESSLNHELDSIINQFYGQGYLSAFWEQISKKNDSIFFELNAGDQFVLSELKVGNLPDEIVRDFKPPTSGFSEWNEWTGHVIEDLENRGYPFANIKLDSLDREGREISAAINLDFGPYIIWDSVQVSGSSKTKSNYVQNLTRIRIGDAFSEKEFENAISIVNKSPYFELVERPQVAFRTRSASPIFNLRERKVNILDGVIGLLPNENEPGKVLITGQLDLELYHLGGRGRDVTVHWQRMNKESQSLDLGAKESFVFNSPLSVSLGFNLLKQDTTFLNRFFILDLDYQFSQNSSIRFFTQRKASDLISTFGYSELENLPEVVDYRWNLYGLGLDIDRLDSPLYPRRGTRFQVEFAAGNKRIIQNTGIPEIAYQDIDLNTPQWISEFQLEKHLFIKKSWGMWFRGNSGFTRNENLFINDLFRIGGLKTIRGFNENFFFAKTYGYINMEQRLYFGSDSYLMIFSDFGYFNNPYLETKNDYPVSFGSGINLETGNGVFRFIYGLGKSNLQPLSFSYSRIHFGYLARF